jgi:formylglycine-generating enzyme required for sulfatase activity
MEFIWIPPGRFMMGATEKDKTYLIQEKMDWYQYETPRHEVQITQGFWLGKYPVTQAQWQAVMGNNPSYSKGVNRPVEQVSWDDAQEFLKNLRSLGDFGGLTFRLPSEAEWEYACRAGTQTAYSFGDDPGQLGAYAWYYDNSGKQTQPVGQKKPNAWGLYDMHGNVWEWCADVRHENYNGAPTDGSIWETGGDASYRLLRGGSWFSYFRAYLRCAYRNGSIASARNYNYGLRVARGR